MTFQQQKQALISEFEAKERSVLDIFTSVKIESLRQFRTSIPESITVNGVTRYKTVGNYDTERMYSSFIQFHKAMDMWTNHPSENDALLLGSALESVVIAPGHILTGYIATPGPMLTEVLCTRGPKALMGARLIFKQLYGYSLASRIEACTQRLEIKVLRVLCSGIPRKAQTDDETKDLLIDARLMFKTMRIGGPDEDEDASESDIEENMDEIKWDESDSIETLMGRLYEIVHRTKLENDVNYGDLINILKIRRDPVSYFVGILEEAFETNDTDALTRVIVTQALVDMKMIKKVFFEKCGVTVKSRVNNLGPKCFKDFLLKLLAYSGAD